MSRDSGSGIEGDPGHKVTVAGTTQLSSGPGTSWPGRDVLWCQTTSRCIPAPASLWSHPMRSGEKIGPGAWTRTRDLPIIGRGLNQLSFAWSLQPFTALYTSGGCPI